MPQLAHGKRHAPDLRLMHLRFIKDGVQKKYSYTRHMNACLAMQTQTMDAHMRARYDLVWQKRMVMRADTELPNLYSLNRLPGWSWQGMLDEIAGTSRLYMQTGYADNLAHGLRHICARMHEQYRVRWDVLWFGVRLFGTIALKSMTLLNEDLLFDPRPFALSIWG